MIITPFSCLMAILWCDLFILLLAFLRHKTNFIMHFGLMPLLCLLVTTVLRLFLVIEFPHAVVINDYNFMNTIYQFFVQDIFFLGHNGISIASVLIFIWASGSSILIVRFFFLYFREKSATDAFKKDSSDDAIAVLNSIAGKKASCFTVARSSLARVPYIIGFFKPVIVLPEIDYTESELSLILTHEVQHHFNRDQWVKLLINMLCYIMWWNPLVYILKTQLDLTLEIKCDFSVLKALPEDMHDNYFEAILNSYKAAQTQAPVRACALVQTSGIKQRFVLGLNYDKSGKSSWGYNVLSASIILILFLVSYSFVLQPAGLPPATDEWGYNIVASEQLEDGYLVLNADGSYTLKINGQDAGTINDPSVPPFVDMPIIVMGG